MPAITDELKIRDGYVMGYVRTDKVGSECTYKICSVEDWEDMTQQDADETAYQAMLNSGVLSWGY